MYWILFISVALLSYIVQNSFKKKIAEASRIPMRSGLTGREVAEKMLRENGINDVKVVSIPGELTDNFNPSNKTVNLSEAVYAQPSIAAAAVAAHECGHAVQHATGYLPVKLRSALVPVVSFSSRIVTWVLLLGMIMLKVFPQLMLAGLILFGLTTLFSFITLPVELNASKRALEWLDTSGLVDYSNRSAAEGALRAAACTYVVAALSSLATLIYYIMIFSGGNRR